MGFFISPAAVDVGKEVANIPFGSIGSTGFLYKYGTGVVEGSLYAGSGLYPAGVHNDTASYATNVDSTTPISQSRGATGLTGTWRALGRNYRSGTTTYARSTLYMRVA